MFLSILFLDSLFPILIILAYRMYLVIDISFLTILQMLFN